MKPIPNHSGYFASEAGEIFSTKTSYTPRLLSLKKRVNGYPVVALFTNWKSKPKHRFVHQLILETFVGARPPGFEAAHRNGVRHDCRAENLCWSSKAANVAQIDEHGHRVYGDGCSWRKLNARQAQEIVNRHHAGKSSKGLAREYGIDPKTVSDIIKGKIWRRDVIRPINPPAL